ncbi:MAG: response regulator [Elusimicrobia bacterium]|nr:response regulator [Elusimicrobiota bacterium]
MTEKILIVDDDTEFRKELKDYLEEYEVVDVGNGEDALKILRKPNEVDLVILDVMMPGLNGLEVLREIKKIDAALGIIILTGYSSKDVVIEALKGRADDFLEKPLDINKVKETVEKVLEIKKNAEDIEIISVKDKIAKVKRFIERNCCKKICLNDAADMICLSPKYLSRIFKENTGKSFSQYKIRKKVEKAKKYLFKNDYNVNQIAYKLCYENAESFIRQFKRFTNCTPTEYRKKYKIVKKGTGI